MPANPLNTDDYGGELYNLALSDKARPLLESVKAFIRDEIEPATDVQPRRQILNIGVLEQEVLLDAEAVRKAPDEFAAKIEVVGYAHPRRKLEETVIVDGKLG